MSLEKDGNLVPPNSSDIAKMSSYYAEVAAQNGDFNSTVGYEQSTDLSLITEEPGFFYAGAEGLLT